MLSWWHCRRPWSQVRLQQPKPPCLLDFAWPHRVSRSQLFFPSTLNWCFGLAAPRPAFLPSTVGAVMQSASTVGQGTQAAQALTNPNLQTSQPSFGALGKRKLQQAFFNNDPSGLIPGAQILQSKAPCKCKVVVALPMASDLLCQMLFLPRCGSLYPPDLTLHGSSFRSAA